jgi:hypothetical protein
MITREHQDRARQAVSAELAARQRNPLWLTQAAGIDAGTLADFLGGSRWPKTSTQGKIERAIGWQPGTINAIAHGAPAPEPAGMAAGGDQDLDELIAELRNAPPERRKLLRDLLASWRQTG